MNLLQYIGELFSKKYINGVPRYIYILSIMWMRYTPAVLWAKYSTSFTGVQQGDPLFTLGFALAIRQCR